MGVLVRCFTRFRWVYLSSGTQVFALRTHRRIFRVCGSTRGLQVLGRRGSAFFCGVHFHIKWVHGFVALWQILSAGNCTVTTLQRRVEKDIYLSIGGYKREQKRARESLEQRGCVLPVSLQIRVTLKQALLFRVEIEPHNMGGK